MIRLFVCGDFRARDASKISVDENLGKLISQSDYAICNFEAPVVCNGKVAPKSGPSLDQDIKSPTILKKLGFNVLLLANNHIMDYGIEGCKKTIESFNGCICVGAGEADEAYQVRIVEKNGIKIGFLSLVQHEFGVVESLSDKNAYGAAWINSYDVEEIIKNAKDQVDYLLVLPHAGVEHTDAPLPEWRRCYKKFVDWGADMIIASHPHCPQGWELYQGKHIFYSLGNFYFDGLQIDDDLWYKSLAIDIEIKNEVCIKIRQLFFEEEGIIGIDDSEKSKEHIEYLNRLLADKRLYDRYIFNVCRQQYDGIKYGLLRGICGFTFHTKLYYALRLFALMLLGNRDEMYMLNAFQNESHRWLIERYLRNKIINK